MSMMGDGVEEIGARVTLVGAEKAAADAKLVSREVKGIGTAAEESSVKSSRLGSSLSGFFGRVSGVSGKAASGVARVGAAGENVGRSLERAGIAGAGMLGALSKGLAGVGGNAGGLVATLAKLGVGIEIGSALAVGTGMYEAVHLASDFNFHLSLVQTQAHAAATEIGNIRSGVLKLAGQTAQAPNELADAMYKIESNGLRGRDALNALTVAAKGASIGHANLVDVANALGAIIHAKLVPGVHDYAAAMGLLNATVGAGDMYMQNLAEAFGGGNLAAISAFGVTLKDAGAALADFGDGNLRGAAAGTQLRMAVQHLAAPAKEGRDILRALGMSSTQLAEDMRKGGLLSAISDLHAHLQAAGVTGSKVGEVLTRTFGARSGTGINTLEITYDRFVKKYGDVDKGVGKFGADWKATTAQTSFQFHQMISASEAWFINLGEKLIPKLEKLGLTLEHAGVWLSHHKIILAAIGGVIGAVVIPALVAVNALLIGFLVSLLIGTAPFIVIFGGIGAAIYEVATHFGDIKQWAADAFDFVKKDVLEPFVNFFLDWGGKILNIASKAFGWMPGLGGKLKGAKAAFAEFKTQVDASLGDTHAQLQLAQQDMSRFNQATLFGGVRQVSVSDQALGTTGVFRVSGSPDRKYASGGIVTQRTHALIGESGPEVVLPLNDPRRSMALLSMAQHLTSGFVTPSSTSTVPETVTEAMTGPRIVQLVLDRKVIAEAVINDVKARMART